LTPDYGKDHDHAGEEADVIDYQEFSNEYGMMQRSTIMSYYDKDVMDREAMARDERDATADGGEGPRSSHQAEEGPGRGGMKQQRHTYHHQLAVNRHASSNA